jgi:two-component system, OmpR family, alkaline phosphatase synthesis response regulator PhoP
MSNGYKILVVDDEQDILEFVSYNLRKEGFLVFLANSGKLAIDLAKEALPHLILLDVMMPGMDGIETCSLIREIPELRNTLIAFLTARSEDYSQIAGFTAGGDDYIAKPVRPKVLVSRIRALLKRFGPISAPVAQESQEVTQKHFGNITIDFEKYIVKVGENDIYLPRKEFVLLQLLTSRPSKVFTRDEIFDHIWGDDTFVGDRTIDVYIRKLREKLGDERIKTIKGVGYKFEYTS